MRKKKFYLILVILILIMVSGYILTREKERVKVYMFIGDGCSHCEEAEEWFTNIDSRMKKKIDVIYYETWHNEENSKLKKKVAITRKEKKYANGVPYIIIGDKSWHGFSEEDSNEIKKQINKTYRINKEKRYDVMKIINEKEKNN